jgi:hypothetical protein
MADEALGVDSVASSVIGRPYRFLGRRSMESCSLHPSAWAARARLRGPLLDP